MSFSEKIIALTRDAEGALAPVFAGFDEIACDNTARVLESYRRHRVSETMLAGSTGYGYGDAGRDTMDKIYADVFGAQAAFVRHQFVNGTHAISTVLFGLLRPGDVMLSVTGRPYDTLSEVIGDKTGNGDGSLADFGIRYDEVALLPDGGLDFAGIERKLRELGSLVKVVFIQRSKGYANRPTLSSEEIGKVAAFSKARCGAYVVVDNCYGEFCDRTEPTAHGADVIVGSLIKNPGGGMAQTGGYVVGTARAVELISYRLTTVGIGTECGASLGQTRDICKGFFFAPHVVAQAKKTAALAAYVFGALGYAVEPSWDAVRHDIIQTVKFGSPDGLCAFCRGIQSGSPVDAFVVPEPWDMPGYEDKVIMAAGTFTQGSSIELSADGPLRPPYTAYFQGGLTYESGKYAIMTAAQELLRL